MSYLNEFHPEVFAVTPRPGGVAKIKPADLRPSSRQSSTKNVPGKGSKSTIRSATRKGSKVTIKSTTTASTFDSMMSRPVSRSTPKKTTREYRIKKILSSSPWSLYEDEEDENPDNTDPPDPLHDAMTILSASISTIMLMSAGYQNIPRDQMVWTQSYLECVKDDYGNYPPNVRGIMNHMKNIDSTLTSFFEDNLDEDLKSDLAQPFALGGTTQTPAEPVPSAEEA